MRLLGITERNLGEIYPLVLEHLSKVSSPFTGALKKLSRQRD